MPSHLKTDEGRKACPELVEGTKGQRVQCDEGRKTKFGLSSFILRPLPLRRLAKDCKGGLLLEMAIMVFILVVVGTAVLTGVSTTHLSGAAVEVQSTAENIGRNQMESVMTQPYQAAPSNYAVIATPEGYSVTAVAEEDVAGEPNVQRVIVTVSFAGEDVLILETIRVNG
jgi:hypothetical protein